VPPLPSPLAATVDEGPATPVSPASSIDSQRVRRFIPPPLPPRASFPKGLVLAPRKSVRDMAQAWNEELDLMRALSIEAASRTTSRKPSKDSPKPLEGDGEALPPSPRTPELSSLGAEKPSELTNN